ncbi:MAG TPA: DUF72 domain-containing protein [Gammaproteobacteria bacterium]|nr:DUF72 domain-containing protein [Gammaproteobacteria bacterium]
MRVGTSGWSYAHWHGVYYPARLRPDDRLAYYAREFDTVEINHSFYRLPVAETFSRWCNATPPGFVFAVKASRYITHQKKLHKAHGAARLFLERAAHLKDKLGPVLFQLPPRWRCNTGRLQAFVRRLPPGRRYAFEFRDASWHRGEVCRLLQRYGMAFCVFDLAGRSAPFAVTADFVYLRLHGPGAAYCGRYGEQGLRPWAAFARQCLADGRDVYCYFDNDESAHAVADARSLRALLRA